MRGNVVVGHWPIHESFTDRCGHWPTCGLAAELACQRAARTGHLGHARTGGAAGRACSSYPIRVPENSAANSSANGAESKTPEQVITLCRHRVCAGGGPPECRIDRERRASHLAAFQGRPVARQFPRYTGNRLRWSYRLVGLCNGGSKQVFSKVFVILIVAILISLPEISTRCTPTPSDPPADHRAAVAPRFGCPLLPFGRVPQA
jgi:hypothetical protein